MESGLTTRTQHMDIFSTCIDEMNKKEQGNPYIVLRALSQTKRFNVFEATDNKIIASTIDYLFKQCYIKDVGGGYPWTNVEITHLGENLLMDENAKHY